MSMRKVLALSAIPSALLAYGWARYQKAVDELDRYQPASPVLPGTLHAIPTTFGTVSYRIITGDPRQPPLVLIHGWGRTGDSAWWTIVWKTDRTMILVDLPGHGRSRLNGPFSLDLAAESVIRIIKHAELEDPVIVGHSMGGAVALLVGRKLGRRISHIGIIASSAFWVRPKVAVTLAAAPYVMAPNSPIIIRRQHRQAIQVPNEAGRVVWEYAARPARSTLEATARALKSFDARKWDRSDMAPITWMVTKADGIIDPDEQVTSARIFTEDIVEVQAEHSVVMDNPDIVAPFLELLGARTTRPAHQVVDL
ncbi:MAG: alpha/beta hydrolase [Acidimicrobiia bacterium]|nr:alpha/beta hydrolase [Acidimicrobiia bacterium]MDH5504069.1 alpha/beta hydrolase [Acidimicrobiia bacterium]